MPQYSTITIIYNPNSTGPGLQQAKKLHRELAKLLPHQQVEVVPTQYAGHAEELAYSFALASPNPLIICASGDGGYHEVVNGLMKAQEEGATPTACLLPAGNGNDHFKSLHDNGSTDFDHIPDLIATGKTHTIDLLRLKTTGTLKGKSPDLRYAHSYIGFGLTPTAGQALNKTDINWFNQTVIAARAILLAQPVKVAVRGKKYRYDSLVFSNVKRMAKYMTLSKGSVPNDGKFEVTAFKHQTKLQLLASLLQATARGLESDIQTDHYTFTLLRNSLVQMDGEIMKLPEGAKVTIQIENKILRCVF
jgi:diacylglycerol kinase (ATP)